MNEPIEVAMARAAGRTSIGLPCQHQGQHAASTYVTPDQVSRYAWCVKQIWTSKPAQLAGKYSEHAPMATVCCNACRACVTTNLVGLLVAAVAFVGLAAKRLVARLP